MVTNPNSLQSVDLCSAYQVGKFGGLSGNSHDPAR
jgi:hypothetical protein